MRAFIAALAAAGILGGIAFTIDSASAQQGMRAGPRIGGPGFAGPRMGGPGFAPRSFSPGPRFGGPGFAPRAFAPGPRFAGPRFAGPRFAGPQGFRAGPGAFGPRWAGPGRRWAYGPGFRHRRFARVAPFVGFPFFAGSYYASSYPWGYYGDDCIQPRRIWTDFGWRVRYVNVCDYY
jgi:hypothetical protein